MKKKFNPNRYFEKYDPSGKGYDPKQEYMIQSQKGLPIQGQSFSHIEDEAKTFVFLSNLP